MAFREFDTPQLSRRSLLRGGAYLGAGALVGGLPFAGAALAAETSWPAVTKLVTDYVGSRKLANIVAAMGRGQMPPEVIAAGMQTIGTTAAADIDSLYRIYSMTKPVTGMATMMLIDEGKLGLDQPLAEILPAFANMQVQKTYDGGIGAGDLEPAARPVTIRHLLTHTAGIGYTIIQKGPIKTAYEDAGLIAGQVSKLPLPAELGRGKPVGSLELFADGLAKMPLVAQPGTRWIYSMGLDLMGRVIEVASGMPFDAYLKQAIFDPAGMSSTFFTVPASELSRLTTNYGVVGGQLLPIDPATNSIYADKPAFPFGGAGLVSSARDYDRFLRMLLGYGAIDGKRVMSELAVRVGTSNLLPDGVDLKGTWVDGGGFGAGGRVGLGDQAGTYGWAGAAGTVGFVDFRHQLRATMMTQFMPDSTYPLNDGFRKAVASDLVAMAGR
ncbi:serine hydrolase domain-containing protein [Tsuneonella amylolytica]|uniref:serine hydrolase domain-containing protein n=1 Tax=Tsuneonella amylolytica TaxID=2338327 RepID=UPI000EAA9B28|nr:serine hydrolase domain-containing protein [Tsuneonella amylolytica]